MLCMLVCNIPNERAEHQLSNDRWIDTVSKIYVTPMVYVLGVPNLSKVTLSSRSADFGQHTKTKNWLQNGLSQNEITKIFLFSDILNFLLGAMIRQYCCTHWFVVSCTSVLMKFSTRPNLAPVFCCQCWNCIFWQIYIQPTISQNEITRFFFFSDIFNFKLCYLFFYQTNVAWFVRNSTQSPLLKYYFFENGLKKACDFKLASYYFHGNQCTPIPTNALKAY